METVYQVVTEGHGAKLYTKEEFFKTFRPTDAESNPSRRIELQGQPKLPGLYGPMYGGIQDNNVIIRYECAASYRMYSY